MINGDSIYQYKKKINSLLILDVRRWILAIFLISSFLQKVVIFEIGTSFKLVHLTGLLIVPLLLIYDSRQKLNVAPLLTILFLYFHTGLSYLRFGFNSWSFNMIFCTLTVILTFGLSDDFTLKDWMWIGNLAAVFFFICILFNLARSKDAIWQFVVDPSTSPSGKPAYLSTFSGGWLGGINSDSSWLGLFTFLTANTFFWLPMVVMTLLLGLLLNSRAGLLSGLAFVVWVFAHWIRKLLKKEVKISFWDGWNKIQRKYAISLTTVIITSFLCLHSAAYISQKQIFIQKYQPPEPPENSASSNLQNESSDLTGFEFNNTVDNTIKRLNFTGNEPGSQGRLRMWKWVPKEFAENIWGYGLGNGIKQVAENNPKIEDNLHNIYLQVLLDQGIIGILILFVIIVMFIRRELLTLAANPLAGFILCYLCLGMVQYRFLDIPFWFVVGAYISLIQTEKRG